MPEPQALWEIITPHGQKVIPWPETDSESGICDYCGKQICDFCGKSKLCGYKAAGSMK